MPPATPRYPRTKPFASSSPPQLLLPFETDYRNCVISNTTPRRHELAGHDMAHKQKPAASPGYGAAYTHTARRVLHAGLRLTFFYPDCTVGAGVSPARAVACSWALPPIGNCATARSPCPESVQYVIGRIIPAYQGIVIS